MKQRDLCQALGLTLVQSFVGQNLFHVSVSLSVPNFPPHLLPLTIISLHRAQRRKWRQRRRFQNVA